MDEPVVCLFPHSKDEFEDTGELRNYLRTELPKDGRYLAGKFKRVFDKNFKTKVIPCSLVLFRKGEVVGKAVIQEPIKKLDPPVKARTARGILKCYYHEVVFIPERIKVYPEDISVARFEEWSGKTIPRHFYGILSTRKAFEEYFGEL